MQTIGDLLKNKEPEKHERDNHEAWNFLRYTCATFGTDITAKQLKGKMEEHYGNITAEVGNRKPPAITNVLNSIGITNLDIGFDQNSRKFTVTPRKDALGAPRQDPEPISTEVPETLSAHTGNAPPSSRRTWQQGPQPSQAGPSSTADRHAEPRSANSVKDVVQALDQEIRNQRKERSQKAINSGLPDNSRSFGAATLAVANAVKETLANVQMDSLTSAQLAFALQVNLNKKLAQNRKPPDQSHGDGNCRKLKDIFGDSFNNICYQNQEYGYLSDIRDKNSFVGMGTQSAPIIPGNQAFLSRIPSTSAVPTTLAAAPSPSRRTWQQGPQPSQARSSSTADRLADLSSTNFPYSFRPKMGFQEVDAERVEVASGSEFPARIKGIHSGDLPENVILTHIQSFIDDDTLEWQPNDGVRTAEKAGLDPIDDRPRKRRPPTNFKIPALPTRLTSQDLDEAAAAVASFQLPPPQTQESFNHPSGVSRSMQWVSSREEHDSVMDDPRSSGNPDPRPVLSRWGGNPKPPKFPAR